MSALRCVVNLARGDRYRLRLSGGSAEGGGICHYPFGGIGAPQHKITPRSFCRTFLPQLRLVFAQNNLDLRRSPPCFHFL